MSTATADASDPPRRSRLLRFSAGSFGTVLFLLIALPCFLSLPITLTTPIGADSGQRYNDLRYQESAQERPPGLIKYERTNAPPADSDAEPTVTTYSGFEPLGTDDKGRSLLMRCLLGGAISLGVGVCAAMMAVFIGVTWGAMAGYLGGRIDSLMMRVVDILYALPYLLLVVLLSVAVNGLIERVESIAAMRKKENPNYEPSFLIDLIQNNPLVVNLLVLVVAIGGVSWLTMARVIRGQVLSLRSQPFIEAARAQGMGAWRIMRVHLLPNLVGPIVVYTTLAVPQAILQESFLSFLGIGVPVELPSWGSLASEGIKELPALALPDLNEQFMWWLLVFPCVLLGLTLLSLNFMGDAMRERFDPRSKTRGE